MPNKILSITKPETLFKSSDLVALKKEYRNLALKYHPDHNKEKDATGIFEHIHSLYALAVKKIQENTWEGAGVLRLDIVGTPPYEFTYYRMRSVGFSKLYLADEFILYTIPENYARFGAQAKAIMTKLPLTSNKKIADEFTKFLPTNVKYLQLKNGDTAIKIPKVSNVFSLRDVLNYYGTLDPKQVAWILSSLYNLNCFLSYRDIVHYDISVDSYFISPSDHMGFLLGGWGYAFDTGSKVSEVPQKTFEIVPHLCKTPSNLICRELIRYVGRELLGDPKGTKLIKSTPDTLLKWVRGVSTAKDAVEEYKAWDACLLKSFGPRRFVAMDITEKDIKGV